MTEQQQHLSSPPQELRGKWRREAPLLPIPFSDYLIAQAAQWAWDQREPEIQAAADAELEACIDVLGGQWEWDILSQCTGWKEFRDQSEEILRAARRPKPPSLKEQAIGLFKHRELHRDMVFNPQDVNTILQALEALPDG
jgi:hypothetical protein